jgi:hypothetical protein
MKCSVVLTEHSSACTEIPDVIGWRSFVGYSILVECKTSMSDFYSDRRKPFRRHKEAGMGQERWYFAEKGVLRPESILKPGTNSSAWGLAEVCGSRVIKKIHPICSGRINSRVCRKELPHVLSIVRRIQLQGLMLSEIEKMAWGEKYRREQAELT